MKLVLPIILFFIISTPTQAEDKLLGNWKAKDPPPYHEYEFKKNSDLIYKYTTYEKVSSYDTKRVPKNNTKLGVWETGSWDITSSTGAKKSCNLMLYIGEGQCCFEYSFVATNLILTKRFESGYASFCENRVLKKEEN